MKYSDLNFRAFTDTAENLGKLLLAYGSDSEAVQTMQDGVDGYKRDSDGDLVRLEGKVTEKAAKNNVMADFRARLGMFGPQPPPPSQDALREIRDALLILTARIDGIEKSLGLTPPPAAPSDGKFRL